VVPRPGNAAKNALMPRLTNDTLPGQHSVRKSINWKDTATLKHLVKTGLRVGEQEKVFPPNFERSCSFLFAYGDAALKEADWTRIQAEAYTPSHTGHEAKGRRLSRVLKLNSQLLNVSIPTVHVDTKRPIKHIGQLTDVIERMRRCNASLLTYAHPLFAQEILHELAAIRYFKRTDDMKGLEEQEKVIRRSPIFARMGMGRKKRTALNDGSFIIRIPSPATLRFEREWRRVYEKGSDRDQPAFAIAYANLYGDRDPRECGNDIWVIPNAGIHDIPGHDFFSCANAPMTCA
jgi:hypothetical protein